MSYCPDASHLELGTETGLFLLFIGEGGSDGLGKLLRVGLFGIEAELLLEEVDGRSDVLDLKTGLLQLQLGGFVGLFVGVGKGSRGLILVFYFGREVDLVDEESLHCH
jgi:hypothetical protein